MEKTYKCRGRIFEPVDDSEAKDDPCFSCAFWRDEDTADTKCVAPTKLLKICIDNDIFFREV